MTPHYFAWEALSWILFLCQWRVRLPHSGYAWLQAVFHCERSKQSRGSFPFWGGGGGARGIYQCKWKMCQRLLFNIDHSHESLSDVAFGWLFRLSLIDPSSVSTNITLNSDIELLQVRTSDNRLKDIYHRFWCDESEVVFSRENVDHDILDKSLFREETSSYSESTNWCFAA